MMLTCNAYMLSYYGTSGSNSLYSSPHSITGYARDPLAVCIGFGCCDVRRTKTTTTGDRTQSAGLVIQVSTGRAQPWLMGIIGPACTRMWHILCGRAQCVRRQRHRVANPWALVSNLLYNIAWLYWGTIREWCSPGAPGEQS